MCAALKSVNNHAGSPTKYDSGRCPEGRYRFWRGKLRRQASRRFRSDEETAASTTKTKTGRELQVLANMAKLVCRRRPNQKTSTNKTCSRNNAPAGGNENRR